MKDEIKTIYVNWKLERNEHKYYVLDWSYEPLRGYEETELTENLIENMIEINNENIDYLGFFNTKEALLQHLETKAKEDDKKITEFGKVEWAGPDFYVNWGVAGDAPVVCNALEALDTEYDIELENGNWLQWLTGLTSDIYTTVELKEVLMELLNCEIGNSCEQEIEAEILKVLDREHPKVATDVVRRVLESTSTLGRIDPAVLLE